MSTTASFKNISTSLFGKTRNDVLALLYSHVDERFYFRQIVRLIGTGLGALQRELKNLCKAGIIRKSVQGNQIYYQANPDCPIFNEIKNLVMKTAGVNDILKNALMPLAERIRVAFIFGSLVKGNENSNSDIDVFVIGNVTFAEVISTLSHVQETVRREINPVVYPTEEFQAKLAENNHFIKSVLKSPKFFIIGSDSELARLAE